ncbi:hypothetical protein [Prochlorococcus marinus]|nr:hypothetical protein [Prochlorococcus marinus]
MAQSRSNFLDLSILLALLFQYGASSNIYKGLQILIVATELETAT